MSISAARPRLMGHTTEEMITLYQARRKSSPKCQACGEPTTRYGYCQFCIEEIQKRINKAKKAFENSPAKLYKEEYVVIDITDI